MFADAEPPHCTRFFGGYTVALGDTRPAALLALASDAVVLADARAAALLATASLAVVLVDARPGAPGRSYGLFSGIPVLVNTLFTQDSKHTRAVQRLRPVSMYACNVTAFMCVYRHTQHTHTHSLTYCI